jgi:hypothetical protein
VVIFPETLDERLVGVVSPVEWRVTRMGVVLNALGPELAIGDGVFTVVGSPRQPSAAARATGSSSDPACRSARPTGYPTSLITHPDSRVSHSGRGKIIRRSRPVELGEVTPVELEDEVQRGVA